MESEKYGRRALKKRHRFGKSLNRALIPIRLHIKYRVISFPFAISIFNLSLILDHLIRALFISRIIRLGKD